MKTIQQLAAVVILALCVQSCTREGIWGIRGEGAQVTETVDLKSFNAINLEVDAEVIFVQDTVYKVEVSAQENIMAALDMKVDAGELEIDFKRNVWEHDGITIVVHAPELRKIDISGSGDILVKDTLKVNTFSADISGSGDIEVSYIETQNLDVKVSGSGALSFLGGTCAVQDFSVLGSGSISAEKLSAVSSSVNISGSGECSVNVSANLSVTISGSGKIFYKGNPDIDKTISGSGKLVKI
ncbi:MAG: head GIN domain-containing protein [Flavobacteriales bacterium]